MKNVSIWLKINFADSSLKNKLEWEAFNANRNKGTLLLGLEFRLSSPGTINLNGGNNIPS